MKSAELQKDLEKFQKKIEEAENVKARVQYELKIVLNTKKTLISNRQYVNLQHEDVIIRGNIIQIIIETGKFEEFSKLERWVKIIRRKFQLAVRFGEEIGIESLKEDRLQYQRMMKLSLGVI